VVVAVISLPIEFPGTDEQRRANRNSHNFQCVGDPDDGEVRCASCDCRPSYVSASWPCGAEVPRTDWSGEALAQWAQREPALAALLADVMEAG
jgi:hypothetical protein